MIILNENMGVDIPNYDDLDNKPKINGVTLEGDLTSEELGIDLDTTRYYTKTQSDDRFQPKGNYLTSIPSEYVTENELNNTLNQKDYATKTYVDSAIENIEGGNVDLSDYYTKGEVDNLIDNVEVDLTGYATEQWVESKGYLTAVPSAYVTETELNNTLTNKNYATKSEIPTIPTNVSAFNNDADYITENALNGYATEEWVTENYQPKGDYQPAGNYLTSIPSEYITETELNDAIAGLGGTDIPTLFIPNTYNGYIDTTILNRIWQAIQDYKPWIVWGYIDIGVSGGYNMIEYAETWEENNQIAFFDDSVLSNTSEIQRTWWTIDITTGQFYKYEETVQLLTPNNIKTINGESLFGSGNIEISGGTTDLSNYYTKTEIDTQIGDINTILENIIG